jgi:hypothetical protein
MIGDCVAVYGAPGRKHFDWKPWEDTAPVYYQPAWDKPAHVDSDPSGLVNIAFAIADCLKVIAKLSPKARRAVVKQLVKLTEDDE